MRSVKQPRALATRERIVLGAARLFALKGYHDTKLEEVLAAARVTSGAFFHHFRSKEDLGFAVLDRHMEQRANGQALTVQRLAIDQFGDQIRSAICLSDVEDRKNIWVI